MLKEYFRKYQYCVFLTKKNKNENTAAAKKCRKIRHLIEWPLIVILLVLGTNSFVYSYRIYPEIFQTDFTISKTQDIKPDENLIFEFSYPVLTNFYEGKIKIIPEINVDFSWQEKNRKLIISPRDFWAVETNYEIIFPEGKSAFLTKIPPQKTKISTIDYPRVNYFYPYDGAKDVVLDIEEPMEISFKKTVKDYLIKFSIEPYSETVFTVDSEKMKIKILPKEKLEEGQKYNIKILAKYQKDKRDNFKEIYKSSFETLPPAPEKWEKDFTLRLAQARRFTRAKITEGKYIDVNRKIQIMSIFENGKLIDSFLISSGKKGMETPEGTFSIHNKAPRAWSKKYGLFMPFWMAVASDGSFGIHELPEWPGGYKEGANHLGTPVSHGCIRLGVGPAKQVYDWAEIGTKVVIY